MKRNPMPLLILVVAVVVGFGLIFSGCGPNQAEATTAETTTLVTVDENVESVQEQATEQAVQLPSFDEVDEVDEVNEFDESQAVVAMEPIAEPAPRSLMVRLPAATEMVVELTDTLSSNFNLIGDTVRGLIVEDVVRRRRVVIPAGSEIVGSVVDVNSDQKIGGQARLAVRFDEVRTLSGSQIAIQAFLEGQGKNQRRRDAATIGGSAAGGALLGRILNDGDRSRGALIGGVLGAAIGAAVANENRGDPVVFESGSINVVILDLPVHVTVTESDESLLARK
jgi:hypothetical protein